MSTSTMAKTMNRELPNADPAKSVSGPSASLANPTKVVAWDWDNTITGGSIHGGSFVYTDLRYNADEYINNYSWLNLTLELLHQHGVISVLGSAMIFSEDLRSKRLAELDNIFGADRHYLRRDIAERIGSQVQKQLEGVPPAKENNKNLMLHALAQEFKVPHHHVTLVDDVKTFEEPARQEGYGFVHAVRPKPTTNPTQEHLFQESSFLFKVLIQVLGVSIQELKRDILAKAKHLGDAKTVSTFCAGLDWYQPQIAEQRTICGNQIWIIKNYTGMFGPAAVKLDAIGNAPAEPLRINQGIF